MAKRAQKSPKSAALKVEDWPLERLREYEGNPRKIPDSAVAKVAGSIEAFGWKQPIVADSEGVVIVGHVRRLAAVQLELPTVPVVIWDLSPEMARAYRLADNRAGAETDWLVDQLADELQGLEGALDDMTLTGFDDKELQGLLDGEAVVEQLDPIEWGRVEDEFWITVRGPLPDQAQALSRLQELMAEMPKVEVELGTSELD